MNENELLEESINSIKKRIDKLNGQIGVYEGMKSKIEDVKEDLNYAKGEIINSYTKLVDAYISEEAKRKSVALGEKGEKIKCVIDKLEEVVSDEISKKLEWLYKEKESSISEKNRMQRLLNGSRL